MYNFGLQKFWEAPPSPKKDNLNVCTRSSSSGGFFLVKWPLDLHYNFYEVQRPLMSAKICIFVLLDIFLVPLKPSDLEFSSTITVNLSYTYTSYEHLHDFILAILDMSQYQEGMIFLT